MPHNRGERQAEVDAMYSWVVYGGEYSVFNALLIAADAVITGGNTSAEYLKNEVEQFGIHLASAMATANPPIDPVAERLYFGYFIFENWETPLPGVRIPLPNKFVPYVAARKRGSSPVSGDHDTSDVAGRIRAVNRRANAMGYSAGFPDFEQANHGQGLVYGAAMIKANASSWRDVLAVDLGNPPGGDVGGRIRVTHRWALHNGFKTGFPNFEQAEHGHGLVYGTILLPDSTVEVRDIAASDLGNPSHGDVGARYRATHRWALANGYSGGYPNFEQAAPGGRLVYGSVLFKPGMVRIIDIPESVLSQ